LENLHFSIFYTSYSAIHFGVSVLAVQSALTFLKFISQNATVDLSLQK